jgi:restriction system protein
VLCQTLVTLHQKARLTTNPPFHQLLPCQNISFDACISASRISGQQVDVDVGRTGEFVPIPDFQTAMLPLLKHLSDGKEHSNQETLKSLAEYFKLSDDELAQLLPSGLQPLFTNRIAWAKSHLKAAGLIESPRRGYYKIRPRGLEVLKANPSRVDLRVLNQFPEYVEFRTPKTDVGEPKSNSVPQSLSETDKWTPEDHLEYGYLRIREQLVVDLLAKVKDGSPAFFEKLVVELLLAMGYGGSRQDAGRTVGRAGDGGIDGVINEDRLGLDVIYIQAKRWDGTVGRPEIQKLPAHFRDSAQKKEFSLPHPILQKMRMTTRQ